MYEVPEGSKTAKGRALQNLISIESGDSVRAVINVKSLQDQDYINNNYIVMCTENGKNILSKIIKETKSDRNKSSIMIIQANYKGGFEAFQKDFYVFLYHMPSEHKISS